MCAAELSPKLSDRSFQMGGLAAGVDGCLVFYGITTLLAQIEAIVFLRYLVDIVPADHIPRWFVQDAVVTFFFRRWPFWFMER